MFLLLIGICVLEDFLVSKSLSDIQNRCYKIEKVLERKENLKNMEIILTIDNLEYTWLNYESEMCYMVNHKSIQEIGEEIARLKLYIPSNDINSFKVSLQVIKSYCHSYLHFMGANFHNIL